MSKLSPAVRCRSPRLRLKRIYRKIAKVEQEIERKLLQFSGPSG